MSLITEVSLVNVALASIGEPAITSLSDTTTRAQKANLLYAHLRDTLLEKHLWHFATRRTVLTQPTAATISAIDTPASPVEVTATAHGLVTGDTCIMAGIVGPTQLNNTRFVVTKLSDNRFNPDGVDGSAYAAYVSGGTVRKLPAYGPLYEFALPSDFFRIARTEDFSDRWRIENGFLVADETPINMKYVVQVTGDAGVATMSQGFKDTLTALLAWRLTFTLTARQGLGRQMKEQYNDALSQALLTDIQQESITTVGGSTWLDGRLTETPENQPSGWADSV